MEEEPQQLDIKVKHSHGELPRDMQKANIEELPVLGKKFRLRDYDYYDHHSYPKFKDLDGMLKKGVGKLWSKVYSNIVAHVKENFAVALHKDALDNVLREVELHPMDFGDGTYGLSDGKPFVRSRYRKMYYVNPKTGLLLIPPKKWGDMPLVPLPPKENEFRGRDTARDLSRHVEGHYYRRMEGIWYEVTVEKVPESPPTPPTPPTPPVPALPASSNPLDRLREGIDARRRNRDRDIKTDWLWKLNIYEAVLKTRLHSGYLDLGWLSPQLHGVIADGGRFFSPDEWNKFDSHDRINLMNGQRLSNRFKLVYAKSVRQLRKAEIRVLGLNEDGSVLPNIWRKKKKRG